MKMAKKTLPRRGAKRKRNAGTSTTSYSVDRKTFGYLKSARAHAQAEANQTGKSVMIQQHRSDGKRAKTTWVYPKKGNPKVLPRGKWINAKIRVTKSGKI